MKYTTNMSKKDMIDHINELEARLKNPEPKENNEEKEFSSFEDLITHIVNSGEVDTGEEVDSSSSKAQNIIDDAINTIIKQYADPKVSLSEKNIGDFAALLMTLRELAS